MLTFKNKINNESSYKDELNRLNNELNSITKNITYLDAYNIIDSVEKPETFNAKVNALVPNSSLVINAESFTKDGVSYSRGDVILKNANSQVVHIKSQTGGVYYPSAVTVEDEKSQLYSVIYKYQGSKPEKEDLADKNIVNIVNINNLQEDEEIPNAPFKDTIRFQGFNFTQDTNYVYGLWEPVTTLIPKFTYNEKNIIPYIKFYTVTGGEGNKMPNEEVIIDYKLELINDSYQVTPEENNLNLWMKVK